VAPSLDSATIPAWNAGTGCPAADGIVTSPVRREAPRRLVCGCLFVEKDRICIKDLAHSIEEKRNESCSFLITLRSSPLPSGTMSAASTALPAILIGVFSTHFDLRFSLVGLITTAYLLAGSRWQPLFR
jgi:hypothetical protein